MIHALLVDDEQIICQGLRTTIPWDKYSIHIVDEAYNGKEALEKIEKYGNIDIVLLDVMMPQMDGLELAEYLYHLENRPKIIMISGYDEFEYAKRALRLGVKDYLLKPVDIDEMLEIVQVIVKEIKRERAEIRAYKEVLIENTIKQLIRDPRKVMIPEEVKDVKVYPICSGLRNYHHFSQTKTNKTLQDYEHQWQESTKHLFNDAHMPAVSFIKKKHMLFTAIYEWNDEPTVNDFKNILNDLQQSEDVYYIIGEKVLLKDFISQYQKMEQIEKHAMITGKRYFFHDDLRYIANQKNHYSKEQMQNIAEIFFSADRGLLFVKIDQLFQDFERSGLFLEQILENCRFIIQMIITDYEKMMPYNQIGEIQLKMMQQSFDISTFNSYVLFKDVFMKDIQQLYALIVDQKEGENWKIIRALKYIHEFYNQDIKATEVADYINISPNYFSTFFKQKTEMSFNEYLNKIRIEQAMILLRETSNQVNMIAESVGYHEYKYFAQVFKKISNLTPTAYRNLQK